MNPQPVTQIHQIEISSDCNLRCVYCPSKDLDKPIDEGGFGRAKENIAVDTFERALVHARHFQEAGTQGELALTGLGEALLHPQFVELVAKAREALPHNPITFSTNGILLTRKLCAQLARYNPRIYVSLHRPEKAKGAVDAARAYGLLADVNQAFATEAFDWAGALDWDVSIPKGTVVCEFLRSGWCVVLADGRVNTCCLDAEGASVIGHVNDEPGGWTVAPWEGRRGSCEKCHMVIPS